MAAALHEQDFLCRIFGKCLVGEMLDREVGDVIGQGIPGTLKQFHLRSLQCGAFARRFGCARTQYD